MKIGVISDTHDRLPTLKRAISLFERLKVQAIFHAGDLVAPFAAKLMAPDVLSIPLYCIYGNNDGERKGLKAMLPQIQDGPLRVQVDGKTLVMHHYLGWLEPGQIKGAHVVVTGHDHTPLIEKRGETLFVNPGECCGWVTGRCTAAIVDLAQMSGQLVDVHE